MKPRHHRRALSASPWEPAPEVPSSAQAEARAERLRQDLRRDMEAQLWTTRSFR